MRQSILGLICILSILLCGNLSSAQAQHATPLTFDFYGETIRLNLPEALVFEYPETLDIEAIKIIHLKLEEANDEGLVQSLLDFKAKRNLDDWLYYQLIRKTAQQISPKEKNYYRYTLYKWYLLSKSGYETILTYSHDKLLFYVRSDELVYNIPTRIEEGRSFVCLNYHDYQGTIDFEKQSFRSIGLRFKGAHVGFNYQVKNLPEWKQDRYTEKEVRFRYREDEYRFQIRLNPEVQQIFKNYPIVDYAYYFNRPMSSVTYRSLIPALRKKLQGMRTKEGVDFLMHFTRYGFLFEPDTQVFGTEKRLSPEETLLYQQSDCEDRAALFFFLVKELYNLPMLVLSYPEHVTIAVGFEKPFGNTVVYGGKKYTVCEPTPQNIRLAIGEQLPSLRQHTYMVAYHYDPKTP
ncbi:MAG: hypothetical protein FJX94_02735 [Bacteroidetes bacterium]|nr:hypothetical protein [Bacteroidota bacterium]